MTHLALPARSASTGRWPQTRAAVRLTFAERDASARVIVDRHDPGLARRLASLRLLPGC